MSGSNMFLTIGAIVLFSVLVINVNSMIMNSEEQKTASEYTLMASNLAQSVINEISSRHFDEAVVNKPVLTAANLNILTPANNLGKESGETLETYDDVDDYNLHSRQDTLSRGGVFNVNAKVNYVTNNYAVTNSITRIKKIEVSITNPYMLQNPYIADTLKLYYYKSY